MLDKLFLLTHPSSKTIEHESNLITEAKKSGIKHIVKQSIMRADLGADVEAMRLHRQAEKIDRRIWNPLHISASK